MVIENWSEEILLTKLDNEPGFSEDMAALRDRLDHHPMDVVIDLAAVRSLNSSNIAQLLRTRQALNRADRRLVLAGLTEEVASVLHVTGLDQIFDIAPDSATALASLKLG